MVESDALQYEALCLYRQLARTSDVIKVLRSLGNGVISTGVQRWCIDALLGDIACFQFKPSHDYERRLLKATVAAAEADRQELLDDLLDRYMPLLVTERAVGHHDIATPSGWCHKVYFYGDHGCTPVGETGMSCDTERAGYDAMTVQQGACRGSLALKTSLNLLEGSTGCADWEAGFFLAEWIFNHPLLFRGRSCLELGSGCGVVGVALARVGAASILLTDGSPAAVANCAHNCKINGCTVQSSAFQEQSFRARDCPESTEADIYCEELRWEAGCKWEAAVILAADVLYDPDTIPVLVRMLSSLLNGNGSLRQSNGARVAYVATTRRNPATLLSFEMAAAAAGLKLMHVDTDPGSNAIMFHHHVALDLARDRIVLHEIRAATYGPITRAVIECELQVPASSCKTTSPQFARSALSKGVFAERSILQGLLRRTPTFLTVNRKLHSTFSMHATNVKAPPPGDLTFLSAVDAAAIDEQLMGPLGFSVDQLMELAGLSVAQALAEAYPSPRPGSNSPCRVLVLAGPGNNGGDGLVAARHLTHFGYSVEVCYPKPTDKPLYNGLVTQCKSLSVPFLSLSQLLSPGSEPAGQPSTASAPRPVLTGQYDVVLDAIFGFSFKGGAPRPPFNELLAALAPHARPPPIISVDIPSGWDVEAGPNSSGEPAAMRPEMLVSLTAPKRCARHFSGPYHYLGGRFVPPEIRERYGLVLPPYPGVAQCVRIVGGGAEGHM